MEEPTDVRRERTRAVAGWILRNSPRLAAGAALAAVAASTGTISYGHIDWLTLVLGGSPLVGHLMPFAVDGQIVVGSVVLLTASGRQAHWGWLGIVPGLAESLVANYQAGIPHGHFAAVWYMVAAQAFASASFMFERWLKSMVSQSQPGGRSGSDEQGSEPETEPAAAPGPVIEYVQVPVEVPVEVPVSCGHEFPANAEEAVVFAFLHARDCEGEDVSQRELSRRYGPSRPKVAELVGPLVKPEPEEVPEEGAAQPEAASA